MNQKNIMIIIIVAVVLLGLLFVSNMTKINLSFSNGDTADNTHDSQEHNWNQSPKDQSHNNENSTEKSDEHTKQKESDSSKNLTE